MEFSAVGDREACLVQTGLRLEDELQALSE